MKADSRGQESPFFRVKPELDVLLIEYRRVDGQNRREVLGGKGTARFKHRNSSAERTGRLVGHLAEQRILDDRIEICGGFCCSSLVDRFEWGKHHSQWAKRTAREYVISKICVMLCLDRVARQLKHVVSVSVKIPINCVSGGGERGGGEPRSGTMAGFDSAMSPSTTRWSTKNRWKDCMI